MALRAGGFECQQMNRWIRLCAALPDGRRSDRKSHRSRFGLVERLFEPLLIPPRTSIGYPQDVAVLTAAVVTQGCVKPFMSR